MNDKKYLLDGVPVSAKELIRAAKAADPHYGYDMICLTSEAADVLRKCGHVVGEAER